MHFRVPRLLKKHRGTIYRRIVPAWFLKTFINKLVIRLNWWSWFVCIVFCELNFTSWSPLTPVVNQRARRPWSNQQHCCHCVAACHWLLQVPTCNRATSLVEVPSWTCNYDVMIGTSIIKTWQCYRSFKGYLWCSRKKYTSERSLRDEKWVNQKRKV